MLEAFPRLHLLLLHLPIGILVALAWIQLWGRFLSGAQLDSTSRRPLVCLLMLTTFAAALTGWLLHESASYPDPVGLHEAFGIALLVVTLLMGWAEFKRPKLYEPLLWLGLVLVIPTGHLGGTLTHGGDFLFGSSSGPAAKPVDPASAPDPQEGTPAPVTYATIRPILDDLCLRCHGERKQRGGLALHTKEAALAGGESGVVWVPGDLEASRLWQVLSYPLDHDEHMPPSNKSQPDAEELAELKRWLASDK